jgi:hypothetical protein
LKEINKHGVKSMKPQTEKRINVWWIAVEDLYTSNEITEDEYHQLGVVLENVVERVKDKLSSQERAMFEHLECLCEGTPVSVRLIEGTSNVWIKVGVTSISKQLCSNASVSCLECVEALIKWVKA